MLTETPFEFVDSHIHLVGWPVLIWLCWLVRGKIDRFIRHLQDDQKIASSTLATVTETKLAVEVMQTNHLAHVEKAVHDLGYKQDATVTLLTSIDKGIAVLVDRGKEA